MGGALHHLAGDDVLADRDRRMHEAQPVLTALIRAYRAWKSNADPFGF